MTLIKRLSSKTTSLQEKQLREEYDKQHQGQTSPIKSSGNSARQMVLFLSQINGIFKIGRGKKKMELKVSRGLEEIYR